MRRILIVLLVSLVGCKSGGGSGQAPAHEIGEEWLTSRIQTSGDVEFWRSELQRQLFGLPGIPPTMPDMVEAIFDPAFEGHNIDRITMNSGELSIAYLIHPETPNGELAIYHQGHGGDFREIGASNIQKLLGAGYRVLALNMPRIGMNATTSYTHELPLRSFIEPIAASLNWAEANYAPTRIVMVGLSGGGWATVVTAAADTRIDMSFPVAGSWPCYLRENIDPGSVGDFEQVQFCERSDLPSYLELYTLGSYQRPQVQIFNYSDTCCFGGDYALKYEAFIQTLGDFRVIVDRTHEQHAISDWAWGEILSALQSAPPKEDPLDGVALFKFIDSIPTLEEEEPEAEPNPFR